MGTTIRVCEASVGGGGNFCFLNAFWALLRGIILPKRDNCQICRFTIIKCKLAMLFFSTGESKYQYNLWSSDLNTIIYNKLSQFIS